MNANVIPLGAGLEGRGVIVTGGASGIGRATAVAMAAAGARVAVVDRDTVGIDATIAALTDPASHLAVPFDLADIPAIPELVARVDDEFDDLWALAHVASVLRRQPLDAVTEADWDLQHTVNLKASFFLNRAVGQALVARGGGGRIINFTSAAFLTGAMSGSDAYVASKGGVVTMTRSFAKAYGPHGILVNCVSPGQIDTPMQHVDNPPEVVQAAMQACPLRRMGQPSELAAVAVFLASTHASFVHGATINVSGGSSLY
jgi:NAD(P)-dependent dehydrogenase (short-subunit alcohol dehydrogenase family)